MKSSKLVFQFLIKYEVSLSKDKRKLYLMIRNSSSSAIILKFLHNETPSAVLKLCIKINYAKNLVNIN